MTGVPAAASLAGQTIGAYHVLDRIGAGGMGEVYRARDTRLGRDVALKILPHAFMADPGRRARFEREARVLAALNHPNIAAVYGFEESTTGSGAAVCGIVLELVEGETLAQRVLRGPLDARQALQIARQIAEALDAAHEKGIVHRDLKPANVEIAPGDVVKVLDFGLARISREATADDPTGLPDGTAGATVEGFVLGTPAYMSPEQARGQVADKRTDIWAFGCVVYEMLAGRPAFAAETVSSLLAAILEHEPNWDALPASTPPAVIRLLRRCLEKDPKRRLRDVGDARFEIDDALNTPAGARPGSEPGPPLAAARPARPAWWLAAAALLMAGAAVGWILRPDASPPNPLAGAVFTRLTDWPGAEQQAAISRDGRLVVFVSDRAGTWDAWVGQIGTGDFHNLTNGRVPELRNPAVRNVGFTPDGSLVTLWVRLTDPARGVLTDGWVVPTMGGPLRPYMDHVAEVGWSPDGNRLVYHTVAAGDPMFLADADERTGRQIYAGEPGLHNHFPLWGPDGRFVYFVHGFAPDETDVWRIRPDGSGLERLTFHDSRVMFPTFVDARTLLYLATASDGSGPSIYALDLSRRVSERVSTGVEEYTSLDASADGRRLVATVSSATASLWRAPIEEGPVGESKAARVALPTAQGLSPRIGPHCLIYRAPAAGLDSIWKLADGQAPVQLWDGRDGRVVAAAAVAPGGGQIAFPAEKHGQTRLYVMNADGTGLRRVAEDLDVRGAPAWSPDGRWIATGAVRNGQSALFKVPAAGGAAILLLREYALDPVWSPSGRFIVYSGPDVGTEFAVKSVTADGTPHPFPALTLSRGARRLAFLGDDTRLALLKGGLSHKDVWVLDLGTGHERQLTAFGPEYSVDDFDVSADGREVVFGRTRDESDIVLIDLAGGRGERPALRHQ
jgi:Tol biopolymer transport system component